MIRCSFAAILLLAGLGPARADIEDARAARLMWSAYQCSVFAGMAGDKEQQERLFKVGYEAGKRFVAAAEAGTVTKEEAQSMVPIGVGFLMAGPTSEFILGRIYKSAADDAYEAVAGRDASNMPRPLGEWITDPELQRPFAQGRFDRGNCELL